MWLLNAVSAVTCDCSHLAYLLYHKLIHLSCVIIICLVQFSFSAFELLVGDQMGK